MRELFISENPYRLLALASDTPYPRLRREADAAVRGARVGIAPTAAMTDKFGDADYEELESNIRSLATDPVRRTCYRLLWPLVPSTVSALIAGGHLSPSEVPSYALAQAQFLDAWYEFLVTQDPEELKSALAHFSAFGINEEGDELLTKLVADEESLLEQDAYDHVLEAQVRIARHILSRAASLAADLARNGKIDRASSIVNVILDSPLDEDDQEASLVPVLRFGDDLSERISSRIPKLSASDKGPPEETSQLETLIGAIGERHPATKSWADAIDLCYSVLVSRWIDKAVDLSNDEQKYASALELLERCRGYDVAPEVASRLARNLKTVKENLAGASVPSHRPSYSSQQPRQTSGSFPLGCIVWAVLAAIGGISSLFSHSSSPSDSSDSSSYSPATSTGSFTPGPVAPDTSTTATPNSDTPSLSDSSLKGDASTQTPLVAPNDSKPLADVPKQSPREDSELQRMIREHDTLSSEVDSERPGVKSEQDSLDREKAQVDAEKSVLDDAAASLDATKSDLDRQKLYIGDDPDQIAAYNRQVNDYNAKLLSHRDDLDTYNRHVDAYNGHLASAREHLQAFNRKVNRVNELAHQINSR